MKERITPPADWELDELSPLQRKDYHRLWLEIVCAGAPEEEAKRRAFVRVVAANKEASQVSEMWVAST